MPEYNFLLVHDVLRDYDNRLAGYVVKEKSIPLSRRLLRIFERVKNNRVHDTKTCKCSLCRWAADVERRQREEANGTA